MHPTLKFKNSNFNKKEIKHIIAEAYTNYGKTRTSFLLNELKNLGFFFATKSGISLGINDLQIPKIKRYLITYASYISKTLKNLYLSGRINKIEHLNRIIDV
jgi:DNA-directed RNA polymerase subunit beta'